MGALRHVCITRSLHKKWKENWNNTFVGLVGRERHDQCGEGWNGTIDMSNTTNTLKVWLLHGFTIRHNNRIITTIHQIGQIKLTKIQLVKLDKLVKLVKLVK